MPSTPEGTYAVDALFREFYNYLGGQDTLGAVISPVFIKDQMSYQYTDAALMVYDPLGPPGERFSLAPLGLAMNISDPAVQAPAQPDTRFVNGHVIYPAFVSLYDRLGGEQFVGKPITEVRYNAEKKRYEQFFERLGFYRLEQDAIESVHLLAYGAWRCDLNCRSSAPLNSIIDLSKQTLESTPKDLPPKENSSKEEQTQESLSENSSYAPATSASLEHAFFLPVISHSFSAPQTTFQVAGLPLSADLTGLPLTEPFETADGNLEQIFENVVLVTKPDDPGKVFLLALPEQLGIIPDTLESASSDAILSFFPIDGDRGYNIPDYFLHYLELHGGIEISGLPITRFAQLGSNLFRQCFVHLCLEEERDRQEGLLIHPAPLGNMYKKLIYPSLPTILQKEPLTSQISLQIWERDDLLASDEQQEIGVIVMQDNTLLENVEPTLILSLPEGNQQTYSFPPTGVDGQSHLSLPPISASNGTLIPYQICVAHSSGEKFCVKESFLIWNNP